MFVLLIFILTIISFSLRLSASGIELANKVSDRVLKEDKSGVVSVGLTASASFVRLSAFIVARVRDGVGVMGSIASVMGVAIFLAVTVSASSFMLLFTDTDETGNLALKKLETPSTTSSVSGSSSIGSYSGGIVPGISEESWNSADDVGKAVAYFASDAVLNPPNGKHLEYNNWDRFAPVGEFDCITFAEAVLQGTVRKTVEGKDTKKGFDFKTDNKRDLEKRVNCPTMLALVKAKPECIVGKAGTSMDKAQPGDLIVSDSHIAIYVGKNTKGKHVIVHASSPRGWCKDNVLLTGDANLEVGFAQCKYTSYVIARTSKFVGK